MEEGGVKLISSDKESYDNTYWSLSKRKELKKKGENSANFRDLSAGVPEEFLLLQDYVQKNVILNLDVVYHRKFMVVTLHLEVEID